MFTKPGIVSDFKYERKKIKSTQYNIYISNKADDPRGIIIEKLNDGNICSYIILADNNNSQVVLLRSILIKIFFFDNVAQGAFPLHCSSICYMNDAYLFLAESKGGKSTIYFSFACYSDQEKYSLMSDDTILCKANENTMVGRVMPVKPSLRKGTLSYVDRTNCFSNQFNNNYNMEDQIYVDLLELKNSKIILQSNIKAAFFINFSDQFAIKPITDKTLLKEKIAMIICGYKATPVDGRLLDFLNDITNLVKFYNLFVPPNMEYFYVEFDKWLKSQ
jgi:hypothetical protein